MLQVGEYQTLNVCYVARYWMPTTEFYIMLQCSEYKNMNVHYVGCKEINTNTELMYSMMLCSEYRYIMNIMPKGSEYKTLNVPCVARYQRIPDTTCTISSYVVNTRHWMYSMLQCSAYQTLNDHYAGSEYQTLNNELYIIHIAR